MKPHKIKRLHLRSNHELPIKYSFGDRKDFLDAIVYNSSQGGMYFEPTQPLPPDSNVQIIMVNYTPGGQGPEAYRVYDTQSRWCRKIPGTVPERYGVGVQLLAKSRELNGSDTEKINQSCEMCGQITARDEVCTIDGCIVLCDSCFEHFQSLPPGHAKKTIKRLLDGNVI